MKKNTREEEDRKDRMIVLFSLFGILFCGVILTSETAYRKLFGHGANVSSAPEIGEIIESKNDIRQRALDSLSWEKANVGTRVRLGDSIFTGEGSTAKVTMKNSGTVKLDESSLVKFSKIDVIEVPNLVLGNFKLNVEGKMKVAIGGEITEIEGHGSEVQVIVKNNSRPQLRLVKGAVKVKVNDTVKKLTENSFVALAGPKVSVPPSPEPVPVSPSPVPNKVIASGRPATLLHIDEFFDLFDWQSDRITFRESRRAVVSSPLEVSWTIEGEPEQVFGQLSSTPDFTNVPETFAKPAGNLKATFQKTLLGLNFYRLSVDGKNWSEPISFMVDTKPLDTPAPRIKIRSRKLYLLDKTLDLHGLVENPLDKSILEISKDSGFAPALTRLELLHSSGFKFKISQPGTIYLRVRGMDVQQRLSRTSVPVQVVIERPDMPEAPVLAFTDVRAFEGDDIAWNWSRDPQIRKYHVKILNDKAQIVERQSTPNAYVRFKAFEVGRYKIHVRSEDQFGRISSSGVEGNLTVEPRPVPKMVKREHPARKVADVGSVKQKFTDPSMQYMNYNYQSSKLTVEGAAFTMYSREQLAVGEKSPTAFMMGLNWLGWRGSNGLEASFKTKTMDIVKTETGTVNPLQAEARYHYRFRIPFNLLSKFNQSRVSLFTGYEYYRNSGGSLFAPQYNLLKFGFTMAFPLFYRWDTGGEMTYGHGFDSSKKYEMAGYLNYFWERNLSLGVGYRIHLFEAGSPASSPLGLPYREGFGEGYSVVRWHY